MLRVVGGLAGTSLAVASLGWAQGCARATPFGDEFYLLDPAVATAIDHEIDTFAADQPRRETKQSPSDVEETLAPRRAELDAMGPATATSHTPFSLGLDLTGGEQQIVDLALRSAISEAVANNLSTRIAALQPAINEQDVIAAEAAFDIVLYGNIDVDLIDQPQPAVALDGVLLGTPFNNSESYRFETGLRKQLTTGGEVFVSTELRRFRNNTPGFELFPDPAYMSVGRLGITQPLLRGFGEDVNTATIRFTGNSERRAVAELTENLLQLCEDVETAYWVLVFSWRDLEIRQWLVDVGEVVRRNLGDRLDFDTKPAEYSDAVARVESRKADVIRLRRAVRLASDELKELINDPELSVGAEAVIRPSDPLVETPIKFSLRETIVTALGRRPEITEALLGIDDAAIFEMVAENGLLPRLDITAQIAYWGMDDTAGAAFTDSFDNQFIDYLLGLRFEHPLGNRAAEAELRRARLERSQAVLAYRATVQSIVLDVKRALRDVVTNFELIQANRSFRIAQAENLRTLEAEEPLRGLTPEFLNLKFQRQERLAAARRDEVASIADFDRALASLYRAMGTGLTMRGISIEQVGQPEDSALVRAPGARNHGSDR